MLFQVGLVGGNHFDGENGGELMDSRPSSVIMQSQFLLRLFPLDARFVSVALLGAGHFQPAEGLLADRNRKRCFWSFGECINHLRQPASLLGASVAVAWQISSPVS